MNRDHMNTSQNPSFVVIKYGDDKEALLNPRCPTQTFVQCIRRICDCDNDMVLDLVDLDGQIKNLPMSSEDYASDYVTGRETYVVIRVEKEGENGPNRYISLLNHLDKINPDLLVKLNDLSRPERSGKRFKKTSVRGRKPIAR
ncbi:hypothetical protein BgiMline_027390 [Biomphalaria glabrata]|uniref:Uncharacterized protein LOC106051548 n=1 Tax=Biomphalaria glabrata TaxID=6526 RepID=A0A2C9LYX1_BIOGL|nr:uncharacterized protein LOC106051548 [Biomphalaria glabrata]XP_055862563.1 uncharacterized protein LOC106051548 [Biomphalaria glabrata]XP_055862564.1 uncharacterized protein LOC106051548 [Biomphalaria glabrata]XP_055862565.1 uncharacterized protein LOC106051548 [Biomphalaria glabrata]KAI8738286.1 hypothetical protein BgiMline_025189 [Biomphalaria glabrata]KAI8782465.1 Uncharacterized protein BgiBS90_015952 [Biomphalaria glabrata]